MIELEINDRNIQNKIDSLMDDEMKVEIHNLFAKIINDYVPMDEGVLSTSIEITKDHVRYTQPYAHYMYMGEVYGPNIPIFENGIIVGWFSPKGKTKYPTGQSIQYNTDKHPLASKEWDKAAMAVKLEEFEKQVKDKLIERARKIYD